MLNEEIRRLKQQAGGDIRLSGSATLAQSLMQAGYRVRGTGVRASRCVLDLDRPAHRRIVSQCAEG